MSPRFSVSFVPAPQGRSGRFMMVIEAGTEEIARMVADERGVLLTDVSKLRDGRFTATADTDLRRLQEWLASNRTVPFDEGTLLYFGKADSPPDDAA